MSRRAYLVPAGLIDELDSLLWELEDESISHATAARTLGAIIKQMDASELDVRYEAGVAFGADGAPVKKCVFGEYFCAARETEDGLAESA